MKLIVAGDFAPGYRIADLTDKNQYQSCFEQVRPVIQSADYAIVNLECPIVEHDARPIEKCGPNLKCTKRATEVIRHIGFKCVTLANNHFYDYGDAGVTDTLNALRQNGIDYVGGGENIEQAQKTLYQTIGGQTIAIINCCEHEFSIATKSHAGSNPISAVRQYYAIQEARKRADFVLLITHGGVEGYQLPTPRMKELYRYFVDCGADAVVNHHQHCFSGFEFYNNKPIIYGLGNFCFDEPTRNSPWNYGYLAEITFAESPSIQLVPYCQCNEEPVIEIIQDRAAFKQETEALNDIISSNEQLQAKYDELLKQGERFYQLCVEPFNCRLSRGLYLRRLLPSLMRRKKMRLLDYARCESHADRLLSAISNL